MLSNFPNSFSIASAKLPYKPTTTQNFLDPASRLPNVLTYPIGKTVQP